MPDQLPSSVIDAITANVAESYPVVTSAIVSAVLDQAAAAAELVGGDAEGTVRRNTTGDIATRVIQGGIPMWRVSPANGEPQYYDMAPTLDWPAIFVPED